MGSLISLVFNSLFSKAGAIVVGVIVAIVLVVKFVF